MKPPSGAPEPTAEILFELTAIGGQMRIVAIDGATGTEVVTIAPLGLSQAHMQMLALRKLRWVLDRQGS